MHEYSHYTVAHNVYEAMCMGGNGLRSWLQKRLYERTNSKAV
jgi:hypothetical protein